MDPANDDVKKSNGLVQIEHGGIEVMDTIIFGLRIKHAFIVTSKQHPTPAAA